MTQTLTEHITIFLKNRKFSKPKINEILEACEKNNLLTLSDVLYYLWDNDYVEIIPKE